MDQIIKEAVAAARKRADEAHARSLASFKRLPTGVGIKPERNKPSEDKFVRDEVLTRADAIIAAATESALALFHGGAAKTKAA